MHVRLQSITDLVIICIGVGTQWILVIINILVMIEHLYISSIIIIVTSSRKTELKFVNSTANNTKRKPSVINHTLKLFSRYDWDFFSTKSWFK